MRLSEIFEGIEGEGVRIGTLQLFIRLFGCNVKCRTCFGIVPGRRIPRIITRDSPNKQLNDVRVDDKLMTFDENQKLVETTVVEASSREVTEWYRLRIEGTTYYVTEEHPFFTTRGLIEAKDLKQGDVIYGAPPKDLSVLPDVMSLRHNGCEVEKIEYISIFNFPLSLRPKPLTVYSLTCAPYNTYLIDYMWVHNCDSKYTWDTTKNRKDVFEKSPIQVFQEYVQPNTLKWVSITGGDPLLQRDELLDLLHPLQWDTKLVNIEATGLADDPEVFELCDFISADIKTPNTGVQFDTTITQTLYNNYRDKIQFKAVVSDLEDILFLRTHYLKTNIPIILTPCWEPKKKLQLDLSIIKTLLKEAPSWRMILQQHKQLFGPNSRNV